jgi:hypothetical protein
VGLFNKKQEDAITRAEHALGMKDAYDAHLSDMRDRVKRRGRPTRAQELQATSMLEKLVTDATAAIEEFEGAEMPGNAHAHKQQSF